MRQGSQMEAAGSSGQSTAGPPMHLAVVACGERLEETVTMIKSAVLFSFKHLHLHIFAEDQLHASFMETVRKIFFFQFFWITTSKYENLQWHGSIGMSSCLCFS